MLIISQIRKRDVRWPQPELTTYVSDQPTTVAHIGERCVYHLAEL